MSRIISGNLKEIIDNKHEKSILAVPFSGVYCEDCVMKYDNNAGDIVGIKIAGKSYICVILDKESAVLVTDNNGSDIDSDFRMVKYQQETLYVVPEGQRATPVLRNGIRMAQFLATRWKK